MVIDVKKFTEYDFRELGMENTFTLREAIELLTQYELAFYMQTESKEILAERYISLRNIYYRGIEADTFCGPLKGSVFGDYFYRDSLTGEEKILPDTGYVKKEVFFTYLKKSSKFSRIDVNRLQSLLAGNELPLSVQSSELPVTSLEEEVAAAERIDSVSSLPEAEEEAIRARIEVALQKILANEKEVSGTKWTRRIPVLEDAIRWMGDVLQQSGCHCNHDMLAEIAFQLGKDRAGETFQQIQKKFPYFGLESKLKEMAMDLVAPYRCFGVEGMYKPDECICGIKEHRLMTDDIRKARKLKN